MGQIRGFFRSDFSAFGAAAPNALKSDQKKPRICPIWGQFYPLWTQIWNTSAPEEEISGPDIASSQANVVRCLDDVIRVTSHVWYNLATFVTSTTWLTWHSECHVENPRGKTWLCVFFVFSLGIDEIFFILKPQTFSALPDTHKIYAVFNIIFLNFSV